MKNVCIISNFSHLCIEENEDVWLMPINLYLKISRGIDTEVVKKVQRRTTKTMSGLQQIPYEERLYQLKLPTLSFRRKVTSCTMQTYI